MLTQLGVSTFVVASIDQMADSTSRARPVAASKELPWFCGIECAGAKEFRYQKTENELREEGPTLGGSSKVEIVKAIWGQVRVVVGKASDGTKEGVASATSTLRTHQCH